MNKLNVGVLRNSELGDCTNRGISSKHNSLILLYGDIPADFQPDPDKHYLKLVTRFLFGKNYLHAEPLNDPQGIGWMSGGNFIWSCDSRFPNNYPISIHDRQETKEQYERMSQ